MLIREDVFCAANNQISNPRARWTIAHEIGHAARGHKRTRHRNVSGRAIDRISAPIRRDEAEAHRFAAALLAPSHLIYNPIEITVEDLASRFNISHTAAKRRKPELERMYRRKHGIPRPLPPAFATFLEELKDRRNSNARAAPQERRAEAKAKGYVGEACDRCGNFTLAQNGARLKCDSCGSTAGCS